MSEDYEFRVYVMNQLKQLTEHINHLYLLVENIERKEETKI